MVERRALCRFMAGPGEAARGRGCFEKKHQGKFLLFTKKAFSNVLLLLSLLIPLS